MFASQLTNNVKFIISYSKSFLYQKMTLSVPLSVDKLESGVTGRSCARTSLKWQVAFLKDIGIHCLLSGLIVQATTDLSKALHTLFPALHLLESAKHTKIWLNKQGSVSRGTITEQRLPHLRCTSITIGLILARAELRACRLNMVPLTTPSSFPVLPCLLPIYSSLQLS